SAQGDRRGECAERGTGVPGWEWRSGTCQEVAPKRPAGRFRFAGMRSGRGGGAHEKTPRPAMWPDAGVRVGEGDEPTAVVRPLASTAGLGSGTLTRRSATRRADRASWIALRDALLRHLAPSRVVRNLSKAASGFLFASSRISSAADSPICSGVL